MPGNAGELGRPHRLAEVYYGGGDNGLENCRDLKRLDWSGRTPTPGKRGHIARDASAILSIIDRDPQRWSTRIKAFGNGWFRAIGTAEDLIELAERLGQHWLKGIRLALKLA